MIKIAICDNDRAELEKTNKAVSAFLNGCDLDFSIALFKDSSELADHMQSKGSFDLLILDTSTRGLSGTELAAELRGRGDNCEIIFVSNTEDYAYEAYKLNSIKYILKPIHPSELNIAIKRAITQIGNTSPGYIVINTSDGIRRVAWNEIIDSYTMGHYQLISITDGSELKFRATSNELYSLLKESGYFMRIGSPYIINVKHLREIRAREITLDNGARIPLPKNSYKLIKKEFLEMEERLKK